MEHLERLRNRWESDEQWCMRRQFILQHWDRLPQDRLLCLAQVFANMKMLGCAYPAAVTEFVRELAKDVPRPERPNVPPIAPVIIVRGSATPPHELSSEIPAQSLVVDVDNGAGHGCEPRKRGASPDISGAAKVARKPPDEPPEEAPSASSNAPSTTDPTVAAQLSKFEAVTQLIKDDVINGVDKLDVLQQAFATCGFKLKFQVRQTIECVIRAGGETLAVASAGNKKKAKCLALNSVWDKFASVCPSLPKDAHMPRERKQVCKAAKKSSVKGERAGRSSVPRSADASRECERIGKAEEKRNGKTKRTAQSSTVINGGLGLEKVVVVEALYSPSDAMSTLKLTAVGNQLVGAFHLQGTESGFVCTYQLGRHMLKEGIGSTKKEAKQKAAAASLAYLQSIAPTLRVKQRVCRHGSELTRDMFRGPEEILSSENVGHKLLKMMGWTGGGMGKGGSGIVDPVVLKETCGRQGLGFSECSAQVDKNFKTKVDQVVRDYSLTVVLEDLVFSPEFNNEERKYIHSEAQKYHLKSRSVKGPLGRFLILSHKISARELLDRVLASGHTEKYEVVMPSQASGAKENTACHDVLAKE
ncbi:hypothetical protein V5799_013406 [Amblyomma americanum]|uniref:NF-kappa-B-repressing factor n=1 Tax=Amblyomma americanum TaxID=6943 RepID=A0AAQ4E605_AMBAM